MCKYFFFK